MQRVIVYYNCLIRIIIFAPCRLLSRTYHASFHGCNFEMFLISLLSVQSLITHCMSLENVACQQHFFDLLKNLLFKRRTDWFFEKKLSFASKWQQLDLYYCYCLVSSLNPDFPAVAYCNGWLSTVNFRSGKGLLEYPSREDGGNLGETLKLSHTFFKNFVLPNVIKPAVFLIN